jgi:uncharacterized membrane protein YfcA
MWTHLLLVSAIAATAWVYASVGLGGGTAYLSILSLGNSDPAVLRPTAWLLNVVAASVGFLVFYRQGHFDARRAWPFLVGGVGGGVVGGYIPIDVRLFQSLLAATLLAAGLWMLLGKKPREIEAPRRPSPAPALAIGAAIGVLSGLVGIGGGIVLGPVLLGLRWIDMKTLAPITALYVLLNSAAALAGFLASGGRVDAPATALLGAVVLVASFGGSRWGARKASESTLKRIFGVVALAAGVKLACEWLGGLG